MYANELMGIVIFGKLKNESTQLFRVKMLFRFEFLAKYMCRILMFGMFVYNFISKHYEVLSETIVV